MSRNKRPAANSWSRRGFLSAAGAAAFSLGRAAHGEQSATPFVQPTTTLTGKRFGLDIGYREVNFTGRSRTATTINGSIPGPVLRWREGDRVELSVTNNLAVDSSIHWHGMILPQDMDGVPDLNFPGIRPGETFRYAFDVRQHGTFWYHSHSGFQEQTGMYGALVIDPLGPDPVACDRDYVVLLSDWSDEVPERVYRKLKKMGDYYNFNQRTIGDLSREIRRDGVGATASQRQMWNMMRMTDRDFADVSGYTYTFLMNGRPPGDGWVGLFSRGEKVRLRIINGSAMTFFDVRIPGLKMTVVAADGQNIEPVTVDEFRIGVAETYDVLVEPEADVAYPLFAQAIDRTGFAFGTLTPDLSLRAQPPAIEPIPELGHADMGMGRSHGSHAGMDHGVNANSPDSPADMMHAAHVGQQKSSLGLAGFGSSQPIVHPSTERGPQTGMQVEMPRGQLTDPGPGLRNNGRRVLTYADLQSLGPSPDTREPEREIQLHLTGNMNRYMWSVNGVRFADAEPLPFKFGERLRITLVNDTMMNHPMHLHGMWSDLETGDGRQIPRKHTVIVQPGTKTSYLVTADAKGEWAYHCHLLYHMLGMFRKVVVS